MCLPPSDLRSLPESPQRLPGFYPRRNPGARPAVEPHMITLGIEGGPRDGDHVQVEAGEDGRPPGTLALDGFTYRLALHGIEPHDERWHYCAGG